MLLHARPFGHHIQRGRKHSTMRHRQGLRGPVPSHAMQTCLNDGILGYLHMTT
jgi:hypothetical protein